MRMRDILEQVAAETRVGVAELRSRDRSARVSGARQEAYRRMHEEGFSTVQIGGFFGRHHSTVIAGMKAERVQAEDEQRGRPEMPIEVCGVVYPSRDEAARALGVNIRNLTGYLCVLRAIEERAERREAA